MPRRTPSSRILSEILDDIKALIVRHIHLPEWVADLLAIFAAYTHCYELFEFAVRIRFYSADPESGKTTTMMLTLRCCQNWRRTDDITGANLSRAFNKAGGCTMGIDEDTSMQGRALVIALLRAGFDREGQRDLMEKDAEGNMSEASYNLFGPVLMTGLDPLDAALQSRCIMIEMMPPLPPDAARAEKKKPKITAERSDYVPSSPAVSHATRTTICRVFRSSSLKSRRRTRMRSRPTSSLLRSTIVPRTS